jgi:hypothetical protein
MRGFMEEDLQEPDPSGEGPMAGGARKLLGRFSSVEELMDAYLRLEEKLDSMAAKGRQPMKVRDSNPTPRPKPGTGMNEDFWEELGRAYEQDPLLTTHMMIIQAGEDLLDDIEKRLDEVLGAGRLGEELADILNQPENAALKNYRKHLEFLTIEKGMDPGDALEFLKTVISDQAPDKRAKAAKNVRKQSSMEVGHGRRAGAGPADNDFEKVLKKSKTLNEMFDGLRKIPL